MTATRQHTTVSPPTHSLEIHTLNLFCFRATLFTRASVASVTHVYRAVSCWCPSQHHYGLHLCVKSAVINLYCTGDPVRTMLQESAPAGASASHSVCPATLACNTMLWHAYAICGVTKADTEHSGAQHRERERDITMLCNQQTVPRNQQTVHRHAYLYSFSQWRLLMNERVHLWRSFECEAEYVHKHQLALQVSRTPYSSPDQ